MSINQKMNKLLAICGLVFIGNATTANVDQSGIQFHSPTEEVKCSSQAKPVKLLNYVVDAPESNIKFLNEIVGKSEVASAQLDLSKIVYLEAEEELELGFETADYLPKDFDPNEVYVDLNQVTYIELDEDSLSDYDIASYLPKDFNPYANPSDIRAVSYIEEEAVMNFDTAPYLPEGFDPYEYYFDIDSIEYIEEEDEVELNFDTQEYLPGDFDPHSR